MKEIKQQIPTGYEVDRVEDGKVVFRKIKDQQFLTKIKQEKILHGLIMYERGLSYSFLSRLKPSGQSLSDYEIPEEIETLTFKSHIPPQPTQEQLNKPYRWLTDEFIRANLAPPPLGKFFKSHPVPEQLKE